MIVAAVLAAHAALAAAAPIHVTRFDTNHSTIGFRVPILSGMSEVEGKFTDFTFDVNYDEQDLAKSSVVAVVRVDSIDTGIADRDKDLRSAAFFDAAKFPELKFESTSIERAAGGYVAHGKLTLHGVTKEIAVPFRVTGVRRDAASNIVLVAFAAEFHLNRRDYGITWTHNVDPLFVGDDITVVVHLISKRLPPA